MRILEVFRFKRDILNKIIAFSVTVFSIAGYFHLGDIYYVALFALAILLLYKSKLNLRFGLIWIGVLLGSCVLSLLINKPPRFFNAWTRLLVYSLIVFLVSPLFVNKAIDTVRYHLLLYIMEICVVLSVGSFFAYFLGINLFDRGDGYLEIDAGKFSGLMNHSIVLGHFAGLSTVYMLSRTMYATTGNKKVFFLINTLFCFGACLLAASRNGVVSCVVASIIAILCHFRRRITKGITAVVLVALFAILSFPIWGGLTDFLVAKNESNIELGGSITYSRDKKVHARIEEFKSSPLFGIGYSTVDPSLDGVNFENGQIEPGSSWLAIASMTGIVGLIPFLIICVASFRRTWKKTKGEDACILSSMLFFYFVHMMAEGYIYAPRSFLAMVFWLIIGVSFVDN